MQTRTDNDSKESSPVEQWTDEALRVKCAELCPEVFAIRRFSTGAVQIIRRRDADVQGQVETFDPLTDLNAMHAAWESLSWSQQCQFSAKVWRVCNSNQENHVINAKARIRLIALIKTLCPPSA